jgi:hypothetical protein
MDKYHEMMMEGADYQIKEMRKRARHLRSRAQICIAQADQIDGEAIGWETLLDNWKKALKALEPA